MAHQVEFILLPLKNGIETGLPRPANWDSLKKYCSDNHYAVWKKCSITGLVHLIGYDPLDPLNLSLGSGYSWISAALQEAYDEGYNDGFIDQF